MTVRVALIGVGAMGKNHARIYADYPAVELVGVADLNFEAAKDIAHRYRTKAYQDYREMLDVEKPTAVTVAVPTAFHLQVALEVIKRGIDLMIEKPIALTVEEGKQIIDAAEAAGVKLMIGHIERFNPAVQLLKRHLEEGRLGRVFQIDARRQSPFPTRVQDVGVVIDLAVHDLDVMRFLTGSDVIRVYAETERRIHSTEEDLLSGLVRFDDGTIGTLTVNWLTPTKIRELYVTGEKGMYQVDYLTQDLYFYENEEASAGDWPFLVLRGVREGRMIRHVVTKREPLRVEIEAFISAVTGESEVGVNGDDGLKSLLLAQQIVLSGLENRAVTL